MSRSFFQSMRKNILKDVKGDILEIGFGTGLNINCYPEEVKKITVLDVNVGMNTRAKKRVKKSLKEVEYVVITAEKMPFKNESFDTVVSTWTLCSIEDVFSAMHEIYRVLKPGGQFIFIEHGLSSDAKIRKWQKRITPIWKIIGDGCYADRNIKEIILSEPFEMQTLQEGETKKTNRLFAYIYQGIAQKKYPQNHFEK